MTWPKGAVESYPPEGSAAYDVPHPQPVEYPQILRTWAWRQDWWRAVIGIPIMGIGVFVLASVLLMPVLAIAVAVQASARGTDFGDEFSRSASVTTVTPAGMLWLNLSLASAVLIGWALMRWLHHLRPRWLMSVQPGIRARFFLACLGLSVVALALQVVVSLFLPVSAQEGDLGGGVNHFGGMQIALALVILLTTPLQAMGEEYAFRGYLMQAFGSLFGSWVGIVVTSLLFALAHGVQNAPLFLDRFAFGLIAGILVLRSGGLEAGIALHIVNNLVAFGLALTFGSVTDSLNVSSVSWWNILLTITQNGAYLVLVLWLLKRMGLRARTAPAPGQTVGAAPIGGATA